MSGPSRREAAQRRRDREVAPSGQGREATWVSAERRRVQLEAEPAKSNLARAHTLQGAADRLRQRAHTEAHQLSRLREEVASATGARALDAARLWFLELSFRRRLHHHLQLVFREMHLLCQVRHHFDADAVVRSAAGPALLLLDDDDDDATAATDDAALPAAPTASGRKTPEGRQREDSNASSCADAEVAAADAEDDQEVSEAEEVCADLLGSSADSGWLAAEEVAAAMAAVSRGGSGRRRHQGRQERRFSPVQWSCDRFHRRRYKDNSGSSNGSNESSGHAASDGHMESAGGNQEACSSGPAPETAAEDTIIYADSSQSEAVAALQVFCELQRQFQQVADALRQHALVADGVLSKAAERRLPEGAQGQREHQHQLLHDVELLRVDLQRTQASVSRSEACLQRVVSALPPAPTMVRLPASPPLRTPRRGLAWFSSILKRRFSRRK